MYLQPHSIAFRSFHALQCGETISCMNVKEIRLINLLRLADEREGGNLAAVARTAGTDPAYLYQIVSPKVRRTVGDDLARRLERAYRLPDGWMDQISELQEAAGLSPEAIEFAKLFDRLSESQRSGLRALLVAANNPPNTGTHG